MSDEVVLVALTRRQQALLVALLGWLLQLGDSFNEVKGLRRLIQQAALAETDADGAVTLRRAE